MQLKTILEKLSTTSLVQSSNSAQTVYEYVQNGDIIARGVYDKVDFARSVFQLSDPKVTFKGQEAISIMANYLICKG